MWSSHVEFTSGGHVWSSHVGFTCGVHMWGSYVFSRVERVDPHPCTFAYLRQVMSYLSFEEKERVVVLLKQRNHPLQESYTTVVALSHRHPQDTQTQ